MCETPPDLSSPITKGCTSPYHPSLHPSICIQAVVIISNLSSRPNAPCVMFCIRSACVLQVDCTAGRNDRGGQSWYSGESGAHCWDTLSLGPVSALSQWDSRKKGALVNLQFKCLLAHTALVRQTNWKVKIHCTLRFFIDRFNCISSYLSGLWITSSCCAHLYSLYSRQPQLYVVSSSMIMYWPVYSYYNSRASAVL